MKQESGSIGPAAALSEIDSAPAGQAYLFTDLRNFGELLGSLSAPAAAAVLFRFRDIVRTAVESHPGAAIRSEGEDAFIVFPNATAAVSCGLAISDSVSTDSADGSALNVGVGVVSGGSATPAGFVGASAVCAIARPGDVVVTDQVRLQSRDLPVEFARTTPRKAVVAGESVALFVVTPRPVMTTTHGLRWRRAGLGRWVAVAAVATLLVAGGAWWLTQRVASLPAGSWTIGVHVPLALGEFADAQVDAVRLAVDETNAAGGVGGQMLDLDVLDEGDSDQPDIASAAVASAVSNSREIAVVGPTWSPDAELAIPVMNRAGLLECSPAASRPILTKPRFGGLDLRSANPDRIAFVRLAASDDIQGPAAASYAYNQLAARTALVIDDTGDGRAVADSFQRAFLAFPGTAVARRALNPGTTDFTTALQPLVSDGPLGTVYFGGFTDTGAVGLRQAMVAMGFIDTPFQSWDALWNVSGSDATSFIHLAGAAAANTHVTRASIGPMSADFVMRFRAAYGIDPDEYDAAAYACTQVIIDSLRGVAQLGVAAPDLREAVRAYAVDPAHRYQTVLGAVGFDANGDSIQQFVTFARADPGANDGKGDWIVVKQQDFGPAP